MARRRNHEGSIYRNKDGTFAGKVMIGGTRRTFYGKTEKEVRQRIRQAVTDSERGVLPLAAGVTLERYLARWLEEVVRLKREDRTHQIYGYHIRSHILPALGRVRLDRLRPEQLQHLYSQLLTAGLAPKTVRNVHGVLSSALAQAVTWKLIPHNVATLASPPALRLRELRTLSVAEVKRLWTAAQGTRWAPLILVTATSGLRQGEVLGLKWGDVDLERGTLQVHRQLGRNKAFKEPKAGSKRPLDLTAVEVAVLREHRRWQDERRREAGAAWGGRELVFCTDLGRPLNHRNVTTYFKKFVARAGLPDIRFHDLRHSSATILAAAGVPMKVIQERLGHSDIRTTLMFYQHYTPGMGKDAAKRLDELLQDEAPPGGESGAEGPQQTCP